MSYAGVESEDDYQARRMQERRQVEYENSSKGRAARAQKKHDEAVSQIQGRVAHMETTIAEYRKALPKLRAELKALQKEGPMCRGCGINPCGLYPGCNYDREHKTYPSEF